MAIRRLPSGRYQADVQDLGRGVPRTKRHFRTRKEAKEWEAAVRAQAHDRLLGRRERSLFGAALERYLREESPAKRSHQADLDNTQALRWPYWDHGARTWQTLEHAALDDSPQGIVAAMAGWLADQRAVTRRAYLEHRIYHQRPTPEGPRWYHQPAPADDGRPRHRLEVTDPATLARLARSEGRGPFSASTLRLRQALVHRVLRLAYRAWRLTEHDLSALLDLTAPSPGRSRFLSAEQVRALVCALPPHLDDAALAAAWIGWRRSNLLGRPAGRRGRAVPGLTWDHVIFPVRQDKTLIRPGLLWYDGEDSKNAAPHDTPMSDRVEQLLLTRWAVRNGPLVFHDGSGAHFGDTRKAWASALKRAGLPPDTRWHDLRHSWASELARHGATDRQLQELGGWKDAAMVRRYAHLRAEHLIEVVNLPGRK